MKHRGKNKEPWWKIEEKQWTMIKKREKTMKNNEKREATMKHDEK